jgi:hypothetical protein
MLSLLLVLPLAAGVARAQAAPANAAVPTTKVLAIGTVVAAAAPPDMQARRAIMPAEVHDTVDLYLAGKIDQWFVRQDGKGVVFLINAGSEAEARTILSKLPLVVAGRMQFDLMPLGPLSPLRYLMGDPASATRP